MKDDIEHKKYKKKQKHLLKQLQLVDQESQDNNVTNTLVNVSPSDGWEAVDMKKRLHPISHYINNREEMIRQVFDVIHGERLKRLIPPSLKNMDIDELKADCLIQLVGMSSKRIKAVLEGRELDISSDESDSDVDHNVISANKPNKQDLSLANNKKKLKTKNTRPVLGTTAATSVAVSNSNSRRRISEDKCSVLSGDDMLEIGLSSSELGDDFFESNEDSKSTLKPKRKKLKRTHKQEPQSQPLPGVSVKVEIDDDSKKTKENVNVSETNNDKEGKTLLEILELEMRARAIRALLKHDNSSSNNELEPSSSSINSSSQNKQKNSEEDNATKEDENEADDSVIETILQQPETIDLTTTNDSNDEQTSEITGEDTVMKENNELHDKANKNDADEKKQSLQSMKSNDDGDELKILDVIAEKSVVNSDVSCSDTSSNNSWAQRWLDKKSKDVKKLVTTSKMCTTIRNKMKQKGNKNLLNKNNENDSQATDIVTQQKTPSCEFEGSIDEYNKLVKTASPQFPPQQSEQSHDSSPNEDKVDKEVDKVSISPQPNSSSVGDSNNTEKDIETVIETTQNENI